MSNITEANNLFIWSYKMSSTWVAEFDNEKDYNHFVARLKEIAPDGGNVIVPELPENPDQVRLRGAWVELDDKVWLYENRSILDKGKIQPFKRRFRILVRSPRGANTDNRRRTVTGQNAPPITHSYYTGRFLSCPPFSCREGS